jgi:hypothetical protein
VFCGSLAQLHGALTYSIAEIDDTLEIAFGLSPKHDIYSIEVLENWICDEAANELVKIEQG